MKKRQRLFEVCCSDYSARQGHGIIYPNNDSLLNLRNTLPTPERWSTAFGWSENFHSQDMLPKNMNIMDFS